MAPFVSLYAQESTITTARIELPWPNGLFDTTSNRAKWSIIDISLPVSNKISNQYVIPNSVQQALTWLNAGLPTDYLNATTKGYRFKPELWSPYRMTVTISLEGFIESAWNLDQDSNVVCKEIKAAGSEKRHGCATVLLECLRDYRISGQCNISENVKTERRLWDERALPNVPPPDCKDNQAKPYYPIDGVIFGIYSDAYVTTTCGSTPWIYLLGRGWLRPAKIKNCVIYVRGFSSELIRDLSPMCTFEREGFEDFYRID